MPIHFANLGQITKYRNNDDKVNESIDYVYDYNDYSLRIIDINQSFNQT